MKPANDSSPRKKILHVITGLDVGGAEMNLVRMLPSLQKHHDNVVCCLTERGPVSDLLEQKGLSLIHLNASKNLSSFLRPSIIRNFRKIILSERPDIIITYLIHADLFGRFWGKLFGVKKIFCWNRGSLLQWQWLFFFDRLSSFLVDVYIFQTQAMCDEIRQKQNIPLQKTAVIPNAVDLKESSLKTDRQTALSSVGVADPSLPTLICVGNLRKGKGHPILLRAFEKVVKRNGSANLLIVGEGEQKPLLETLARGLESSPCILFLGHRKDVPALLSASDIFVLPTFYEGMSNAILEALLAQRAVVTTDIPVNRDIIIHGESGLLVPVRDDERLAEALTALIANSSERLRLAQNGRTFLEKTCAPDMIAKSLSHLITHT